MVQEKVMRLVRNKLENSDVQKFTAEYIFPASCEIKIRNRCAYVELLKIFFKKRRFLVQIIVSWKFNTLRKPIFHLLTSILPSASVFVVEMWVEPLQIQCKNVLKFQTVFLLCLSLYLIGKSSVKVPLVLVRHL